MIFTRKEIAYPAVLIWAITGIALKQSAVSLVASAAWIVVGLLVIGLAGKAGLALRKSAVFTEQ
jgi:hypothetical protein